MVVQPCLCQTWSETPKTGFLTTRLISAITPTLQKEPAGKTMAIFPGSGTPRPKTISARDSSARTFWPIFQSGTARPTLVGLLGPFFYFFDTSSYEPCHEKIFLRNFRTHRNVQKTCEILFLTLSIYLPIRLNPRRGHQTGSGKPSAGGLVSFLLVFCAMLVV